VVALLGGSAECRNMAQSDFQSYDVLGIPISVVNLETAEKALVRWSGDTRGRYVGVREVPSIMIMHDDPKLKEISRNADMNLPDGMPIVWIGKRKGLPVERTCGPDFMEHMLLSNSANGLKHYFFGGKEGVADKLKATFRERNAGVQIVGTCCPPFRQLTEQEDQKMVQDILDSKADVVWVGMSSPKQDVWMAEHVSKLQGTLIGVGAAFDFHSGEVKRAPKWMQKTGLESLHRLTRDPRRLWKRYLILAPLFVIILRVLRKPNLTS